ncbi:DHH family phosphoesterase [Candidatus Saccharibacteria bacterium]|nr:DHH family phosphoesterase [Candidatus Saccharibacteria bacterium]
MYNVFSDFIADKSSLCIIQAENPDADSLGSALALDYLLDGKDISLYCPVDIPKYLHYLKDWSRITNEFNFKADGYIIVDTAAAVLLSKLLDNPAISQRLGSAPVLVLDHHETPDDLPFPHTSIIESRPACCDLIYQIATKEHIPISQTAAEYLAQGILSDTLGLTSASTTTETFRTIASLTELGVNVSELEESRKEYMKKSPRVLSYKAELINRIEYHLGGALATIHIPWEDIKEYSDEYNPNVLILEEMRMVEGVAVAVAIKTYPDGKVTGKIRASRPIAEQVAGYFGGGGHPYAAGFRTYDTTYESVVKELVSITPGLLAAITEVKNEIV